jgi:hypothetical protein
MSRASRANSIDIEGRMDAMLLDTDVRPSERAEAGSKLLTKVRSPRPRIIVLGLPRLTFDWLPVCSLQDADEQQYPTSQH